MHAGTLQKIMHMNKVVLLLFGVLLLSSCLAPLPHDFKANAAHPAVVPLDVHTDSLNGVYENAAIDSTGSYFLWSHLFGNRKKSIGDCRDCTVKLKVTDEKRLSFELCKGDLILDKRTVPGYQFDTYFYFQRTRARGVPFIVFSYSKMGYRIGIGAESILVIDSVGTRAGMIFIISAGGPVSDASVHRKID
jgi:hypothetical protein